VVRQLVDAIPDKVQEATLLQLATAFGIIFDKLQLLKGDPTNINRNEPETDAEAIARIVCLLDRGGDVYDVPEATAGTGDEVGRHGSGSVTGHEHQ
jgi:hypothetical protein